MVLMILDRWLVQISAGIVVGIWLISDWAHMPLSEGTKASLAAFVGYALLKSKSDSRWRQIELERDELHRLVERLESTSPGQPEALAVRRELVELAKRADSGGDDAQLHHAHGPADELASAGGESDLNELKKHPEHHQLDYTVAFEDTTKFVQENWKEIQIIAEQLFEHTTLYLDEAEAILRLIDIDPKLEILSLYRKITASVRVSQGVARATIAIDPNALL